MRNDILLVLVGAVLNVLAQVVLKMSTRGLPQLDLGMLTAHWRDLAFNPLFVLACAIYAASAVNWFVVLSRVEVSLAYPLCTGIAFVLTFLAGLLLFHEHLTAWRLLGAGAIIVGTILICRPAAGT